MINTLNVFNLIPILAFIVLLRTFFYKESEKPQVLIAAFLAFTSSGFGWIYSSLGNSSYTTWTKTYDILTPNSFLISGHPSVSTPLQLIGLVSTFLLFYLFYQKKISGTTKYLFVYLVAFCYGYLGYIDVIICLVIIGILSFIKSDHKFSISMILGLSSVFLIDSLSIKKVYSIYPTLNIFGNEVSLLLVTIVFLITLTMLSLIRKNVVKVISQKINFSSISSKMSLIILPIILVCVLYIFGLLSWVDFVSNGNSITPFFFATGTVPWFYFPIKLGTIALLAIIATLLILKYSWRQVMKRFSFFYLWILVLIIFAFIPIAFEYRIIKYNFPLSVLASVLLAELVILK